MSFSLQGKYAEAKIFTDNVDDATISQVLSFLNQPFTKESNMRIMPDAHAGKGAVIGTTMRLTDKIVPNIVGVDLSCGLLTVEIKNDNLDVVKIDQAIRALIPSGQSVRSRPHPYLKKVALDKVLAPLNENRTALGLGSLGGGNHFIEINETDSGRFFLVIHSGSRHLGVKVATHHQDVAIRSMLSNRDQLEELIARLKSEGREQEIEQAIKNLKESNVPIPKELAYLEGEEKDRYLHDIQIAHSYAYWNRAAMAEVLIKELKLTEIGRIDTVHNYVDFEAGILRKGAISAQKGEQVLIPINMRDGSILARGKGNPDWNYSGPHGAGRILSRSKAKELLSLEDFKKTMKDVYSTSVNQSTLDESPFAYKSMQEIIENTKETIDIEEILKPIYNFKASN